MPLRQWTDDDLRAAVANSASMRQVMLALGLAGGGGAYATLWRHIARLDIDTSHLPQTSGGRPGRVRSWTDGQLADAVRNSTTVAQVLRRLGYAPSGGVQRFINQHFRRLGLDTSHFVGQSWGKGRRNPNGFKARPLDEILVANSTYVSSGNLRRRLIMAGLKEARCERCGLDEWCGKPLPLTLDHINGDPTDNRLENLRILCPNCHAQTDTWCRRNVGRRTPIGERDSV
ncbi:hypothetical protein GCM10027265_45740 [Jatrophihabitans fulvus]